MSTKATHSGHCQACGHLQKLPKGHLSKHGYTVKWGFFSGVCEGAGRLPFEQSCDLVQTFINRAQRELDHLVAFRATLAELPTEPKGYTHVRRQNPRGRQFKAVYTWEIVTFGAEVRRLSDFDAATYYYTTDDGLVVGKDISKGQVYGPQPYEAASKGKSIELLVRETAQRSNAAYSKWLDHEEQNLRRYIAWQTERVATWKPADLLPVDTKDKTGFVPSSSPY